MLKNLKNYPFLAFSIKLLQNFFKDTEYQSFKARASGFSLFCRRRRQIWRKVGANSGARISNWSERETELAKGRSRSQDYKLLAEAVVDPNTPGSDSEIMIATFIEMDLWIFVLIKDNKVIYLS